MLHNDAVQHRAGEQPSASTPKASQTPAKAQTAAKFKIPSRRQADRRQENGVGTGPRAGDNDTLPIYIGDKHSPPPKSTTHDIATHATAQWPLHQDGLTTGQPPAHMYQQQPARYHSLGNGHVQTFSVFGPELGTLQQQLCDVQQQQPYFATQNLQHSPPTLPPPTLHTPPGERHVQTGRTLTEHYMVQHQALGAATEAKNQANKYARAMLQGWAYRKRPASAHVPTAACTKPTSRGRICAGPLGFRI